MLYVIVDLIGVGIWKQWFRAGHIHVVAPANQVVPYESIKGLFTYTGFLKGMENSLSYIKAQVIKSVEWLYCKQNKHLQPM